jgi:hypothetical protein
MSQAIADKPLQTVERIADLPAGNLLRQRCIRCLSYGGRECLRANDGGVAVERHPVVAPRRPILKHEHLAPTVSAQVDEVVARAAKETCEVEIVRFEHRLVAHPLIVYLSTAHLTFSSKKESIARR